MRNLRRAFRLFRRGRKVATPLIGGVAAAAGYLARRSRPKHEVEPAKLHPGSELAVFILLVLATIFAAGFPVVYAFDGLSHQTQLLGICLGGAFGFLAAALITVGKRVLPEEELEEEYPPESHIEEQEEIEQLVADSGQPFTRKRMLLGAGGAAVTALGVALVTPVLSLGRLFGVDTFYQTPWRRGRRLVDERGKPYRASDILPGTFYTAFPEKADKEDLAASLVVVRLPAAQLHLPPGRGSWAPGGIVAYSKICTHAGCAIALYRKPTFPPLEPKPALVCPCHYSTFDPASGGTVIFGPAGRALPQLPLRVDSSGHLRAGGNFSEPVGPSWWGVRMGKPEARRGR